MRRRGAPQRPPRKFVRLVLGLRLAWLLPLTLIALHYTALNLYRLSALLAEGGSWSGLAEPLTGCAAGGAVLFFGWRIWRKTWLILTDRLYPERSALPWQVVWIALTLLLPYWIYHG
ncbi:MAG TPA: hypothetical protein DCW72_02005 [Elusimicrobia bacterium]|nr:MAG: hypothetical protein A2X29_09940 [Elusimicrobia bacterium GWA2_64_40]OGR64323.1 MAG: hypothetical protein A2X30_10945 [Elusimicrobia bacterium GWB2_63_16]HAN05031.1 hypothetical protein [Elusimicrobiota bacterium]HAU89033.1 hypothetical protein [Elusimicrobiota bacterium]